MLFIKCNPLKSGIFFNTIFISRFSGSILFRVQDFLGPVFSDFWSRFYNVSRFFRVWFQILKVYLLFWVLFTSFLTSFFVSWNVLNNSLISIKWFIQQQVLSYRAIFQYFSIFLEISNISIFLAVFFY